MIITMNTKRILALILTLLLCVNLFSLNISAATPGNPQAYYIPTTEALYNTTNDNFKSHWTKTGSTFLFEDSDGTFSVVADINAEYFCIYKLDANMEIVATHIVEKVLPKFGGVTRDAAGKYYVFVGKDVEESDVTTKNLCLLRYSEAGVLEEQNLFNDPTPAPGNGDGVRIPFDAGGCSLTVSGDKIMVFFDREMYKSDDGANHQRSWSRVYNIDTLSALEGWGTHWSSHNFFESVIPISNGFALATQGDAYNYRGYVASVLTSSSSRKTKELLGFKGTAGINTTFAQLGGIVQSSTGFIVAGTYENGNEDEWDWWIHTASRNLMVQVLNTEMTTATEPIYLTDFNDKNLYNVGNVRIVRIGSTDEFVILYELFDGSSKYLSTHMIKIDKDGEVLERTQLPDFRLNFYDRLIYSELTEKINWITSKNNSMVIYSFDPNVAIATGTDDISVIVKSTGGNVITDATITMNDSEYIGQTFTRNDDKLQKTLPYGNYNVTISAPGYKTSDATISVDGRNLIEISLMGGWFGFIMQDSSHTPINGVEVYFEDGTFFTGDGHWISDASKPTGTYKLTFKKEGYLNIVSNETSFDGTHQWYGYSWEKVMHKTGNFSIELKDYKNAAIQNFTVYLDGSETAYTATNGVLNFNDIEAGSHSVKIVADGCADIYDNFVFDTNGMVKSYTANTYVTEVTPSQTTAIIEKGGTLNITATVSPSNADDTSLTWVSSNNDVATVTDNGNISAVAKGFADITVTANDRGTVSATCVITVVDKDTLRKAIDTANAKEESDYTTASWVDFIAKKNNAIMIANNASSLQEAIDAAKAELTAAIDALMPKEIEVDKDALRKAIDAANAKEESDYTTASWADFIAKKNNAIVIANNASSLQEAIDMAEAELTAAIDALMPKEIEELKLSIAISSSMQDATNGDSLKYDALWNATVRVNGESDQEAYDQFNSSNFNIKEYGVFYGTSTSAVERWNELATNPTLSASLKKTVFGAVAEGETEINMFTTYGFRLRNCPKSAVRAAAFYVIYEFGGKTITVISAVDAINK